MMWHWNSLWAPAPGDPPAIDDPALWRMPWSPEQAIALQARSWEAMLSAAHSWWSMVLAAWPVAGACALPAVVTTDAAGTAGAEPLALAAASPSTETEDADAAAAAPARRATRAPRKRTASRAR